MAMGDCWRKVSPPSRLKASLHYIGFPKFIISKWENDISANNAHFLIF